MEDLIRFVVRGRGGGKTYAAVEWLKQDPDHRVIVTVDEQRAAWIRRQYGLTAQQVMSSAGALRDPDRLQGMPRGRRELAIEDLGDFLARAFVFPVGMVTATGDCGHGVNAPNPGGTAA